MEKKVDKKYYLLTGKEKKEMASAFAPKNTKLGHDLIEEVADLKELPFELSLVKLSVRKGELIESNDLSGIKDIWLDYQINSLAWPLFSNRLKLIIEKNLTGKEGINWIAAKINAKINTIKEQRIYYIPSFTKKLDVLDLEQTWFVEGTTAIINPYFSLSKIKKYSMFSTPSDYNFWKITHGIYVCNLLRKNIKKEKLTGIYFEETIVV